MKVELYFGPGACSFVPHVVLESLNTPYEGKLVKMHKGEHQTPEYLAINPHGQVPTLVVDGKALSQIMAICNYLDSAFSDAKLLPRESWTRAQALSQLAWMNTTPHPTFTRVFFPDRFADSEGARAEVKARAQKDFRIYLERVQGWIAGARPFWFGERITFHDAYAFTLLRWGGIAGIDPQSLPAYHAYIQRVMQHPAVAAVLARERIGLDTYKG